MIGFISSRSRRAELGQDPVRQSLLVTRSVDIHRHHHHHHHDNTTARSSHGAPMRIMWRPLITRTAPSASITFVGTVAVTVGCNGRCRYDPLRAAKEECLGLEDIKELLGLELPTIN
jgi:hypothetical protein